MLTRREFIASSAAAASVRFPRGSAALPAVISTWDFGKAANADSLVSLQVADHAKKFWSRRVVPERQPCHLRVIDVPIDTMI